MEKAHRTIAVLGALGTGKSTLVAAVTQVLARRNGTGSPVSVEALDRAEVRTDRGLRYRSAVTECETGSIP